MLKCPNCDQGFTSATYSGSILTVVGQLSVDGDGKVQSVGPAAATMTVRVGEELNSPSIDIRCPKCGKSSPAPSFTIIRPSYLSTRIGDLVLKTDVGEVYVNVEERALAEQIFNRENGEPIAYLQ